MAEDLTDEKIRAALDAVSMRIEEDQSAAYARYVDEMSQAADRRQPTFKYLSAIFEIHAHYHSFLPMKKGGWEEYLETLRTSVLGRAQEVTSLWNPRLGVPFMERLEAHLLGRSFHWKAEVMRLKREGTARQRAEAQDGHEAHPKDDKASTPPDAIGSGLHVPSIAEQLRALREESRLTVPELTDAMRIDQRSVERHLSGTSIPRIGHIGAYERVFADILKRKVLITRTPVKHR